MTLDDLDAMLFHAPYGKLVQKSLARLVLNDFLRDSASPKYASLAGFSSVHLEDTVFDRDVEKAFMKFSQQMFEEKTKPSLLVSNQVGNMYTPSLYSCLASYVASFSVPQLAGKRIGMFSYGSGLAATLFSLCVTTDVGPNSPLHDLHASLVDLRARLAQRRKVAPPEFALIMKLREETHHQAPYTPVGALDDLFPGTWYLVSVDSMHRRHYQRLPLASTNGKAPVATTLKEFNSSEVTTNGQAIAHET